MKYVVKGGGSVLTKKHKQIPEEWDTKKTLDYLIKNKKELIEWDNVNIILDSCTDLVGGGHTVYFVEGGGIFAHPLAKKAGFPKLDAADMAVINHSMHTLTTEIRDLCFEKNINVMPLYYASFVSDNRLPENIKQEGRLYLMSSFVSDRPQSDGSYMPISSDDISISLAIQLRSDYNVMITKKILKNVETNVLLEDGTYTPKEFYEKVEITENVGDVTGGMARKIELAVGLVEQGYELYVMTPEKFPEFTKGKEVGIKLVKGVIK